MSIARFPSRLFRVAALLLLAVIFGSRPAIASSVFTSPSFELKKPALTQAGGDSSSTSFQLFGAVGEQAPGASGSAGFQLKAGYEYFPAATESILTATPGDGEVDLSWTLSVGTHGDVQSYRVGRSTTPGGPYTFVDVGNVLLYSVTGLVNGTTYYFVVEAVVGGENLSRCAEVSSIPAGGGGGGSGSGGGSGAAGSTTSKTSVTFEGVAYPGVDVYLLKDGIETLVTVADPTGHFSLKALGLTGGWYNFALYAVDPLSRRSVLYTRASQVPPSSNTVVTGVIIAPTLVSNYLSQRPDGMVTLSGYAAPNAEVELLVDSPVQKRVTTRSDVRGSFSYTLALEGMESGQHVVRARVHASEGASPLGIAAAFGISDEVVLAPNRTCPRRGDLNGDCLVNLQDFSIAAYWYKKPLSEFARVFEGNALNGDGIIDLRDFSIMATYWSG